MIQNHELSVTIGSRPILQSVDLQLQSGQVTGLVGERGSGNSMAALALICLLLQAAQVSGCVIMGTRDLLTLPEDQLCEIRGRRIGMIFQEPMNALKPLI